VSISKALSFCQALLSWAPLAIREQYINRKNLEFAHEHGVFTETLEPDSLGFMRHRGHHTLPTSCARAGCDKISLRVIEYCSSRYFRCAEHQSRFIYLPELKWNGSSTLLPLQHTSLLTRIIAWQLARMKSITRERGGSEIFVSEKRNNRAVHFLDFERHLLDRFLMAFNNSCVTSYEGTCYRLCRKHLHQILRHAAKY